MSRYDDLCKWILLQDIKMVEEEQEFVVIAKLFTCINTTLKTDRIGTFKIITPTATTL